MTDAERSETSFRVIRRNPAGYILSRPDFFYGSIVMRMAHRRCFFQSDQRSDSGHHNTGPEEADRHYQDHGGQHICCGKHLDLDHAKTGGQHQKSSARFEIIDHGGRSMGNDHTPKREQNEKDYELRNCDRTDNSAEGAGKDQCCKEIQDRLCEKNAVISAHTRCQRSVDPGSAGAEEDNYGQQRCVEFFFGDSGPA